MTLEHLDLASGSEDTVRLTDIEPLRGLSRLTYVDLSCSEGTDLSPLLNKTALTALVLENYSDCRSAIPLSDLSPLSQLNGLERLWLGGRPLGLLPSLNALGRLRHLVIVASALPSLAPVAGLTSLETFSAYDNAFRDLSELGTPPNLRMLNVAGNSVDHLDAPSAHPHLRKFNRVDCELADISGLAPLTELLEVELGYNQIIDPSPLSGMTRVVRMSLHANAVTDISPLLTVKAFGFSGELSLHDNPLDCETQPAVLEELRARGMQVGVRPDFCP